MRHTLRHRFRSGSRLFLEDTTFFSSEEIDFDGLVRQRRFLQFNGVSTWRPVSGKPLLVVARGLLQGTDADTLGIEQDTTNMALTATVTYQYSDRIYLAANAGVSSADSSETDDHSSVFQQARADYRSSNIDLGAGQYRWGGTAEIGNRTGRRNGNGENGTQDLSLSFYHNLSRRYELSSARDLEFNVAQKLTGAFDTDDRNQQIVVHTVYATLSRQLAGRRSFMRLSATDRRNFGDHRDTFQIVNLQASQSVQADRYRNWTGSLTMQYGRTARSNGDVNGTDDRSISYSADLTYRQTDLFGVSNLDLHSELRLLSTEFASGDPFDDILDRDLTRTDTGWRNRLNYRIGLLQFRLEANMRKIDSMWNGSVFLSVRRYYGRR
jgi:hypothetical protein